LVTVSIGVTEIEIKPKRLLDYVEKLDFIKSRRQRPWDLIQGFPDKITPENYKILVEIAMKTVYTQSSSVSIEEELFFDKSEEGFYYDLWRCIPSAPALKGAKKETWNQGINRARLLWESATPEEKQKINFALSVTDERHLEKNVDGLSENSLPPGQEKQ
jgi:hypothetical protein